MYTPCADCENDKTIFHWRTVACSYECGMKYFKMVEEARKPKDENESKITEDTTVINEDENKETTDEVVLEKPRKRTTKSVNKVESEQIG